MIRREVLPPVERGSVPIALAAVFIACVGLGLATLCFDRPSPRREIDRVRLHLIDERERLMAAHR